MRQWFTDVCVTAFRGALRVIGFAGPAAALDVLKAFPVARDHDNEFFGVQPPPQVLKLFTSMDHLKATVYLNMPDTYLGGWSEPGESIKFMISYASGVESWTNAYAHEYGHVCTWTLGPHASDMPWWMQEGAAELAAGKFRPGYRERLDADIRRQAVAGSLPPWDQIANYITTPQKYKRLAYTQGDHLPNYVTHTWGDAARNAWLRAMAADGKTLDEATRSALGLPFADLDRRWRDEVKTPATAPDPVAHPGDKGDTP